MTFYDTQDHHTWCKFVLSHCGYLWGVWNGNYHSFSPGLYWTRTVPSSSCRRWTLLTTHLIVDSTTLSCSVMALINLLGWCLMMSWACWMNYAILTTLSGFLELMIHSHERPQAHFLVLKRNDISELLWLFICTMSKVCLFISCVRLRNCHVNALDKSEREMRTLKFATCHVSLR